MDRNQNESNPGRVEHRLDETPVEREGMQGGSTERESMHGAGRGVERENLPGGGMEREGMQGGEVERDAMSGTARSGAEGDTRLDDQENRSGGYGYDRPADIERSSDGMRGSGREGSEGMEQGREAGRDW